MATRWLTVAHSGWEQWTKDCRDSGGDWIRLHGICPWLVQLKLLGIECLAADAQRLPSAPPLVMPPWKSMLLAQCYWLAAGSNGAVTAQVADLTAKTFYNVYCYAQERHSFQLVCFRSYCRSFLCLLKDTEQPIVNVVTMRAAVATRQRVRTLDTTPPVTFNCTAQATVKPPRASQSLQDTVKLLTSTRRELHRESDKGLHIPSLYFTVPMNEQHSDEPPSTLRIGCLFIMCIYIHTHACEIDTRPLVPLTVLFKVLA